MLDAEATKVDEQSVEVVELTAHGTGRSWAHTVASEQIHTCSVSSEGSDSMIKLGEQLHMAHGRHSAMESCHSLLPVNFSTRPYMWSNVQTAF